MGSASTSQVLFPNSTACLPLDNADLYTILQQEVELGIQSLTSGSPDIAVTLFQSALQKLTTDQPFYDHLIYNLLLSYSLLIEQLLKSDDITTAQHFVKAALQLDVVGEMAHDSTFLKRFAGGFQSLGIMLLNNGLREAGLKCCRKAISIVQNPDSYVNLTNSLSRSLRREPESL